MAGNYSAAQTFLLQKKKVNSSAFKKNKTHKQNQQFYPL